MATNASTSGSLADGPAKTALPSEVPYRTRLSWELGTRVIEDEATERRSHWEGSDGTWELTVFDATTTTLVMRVRTPVGRERFYGAETSMLSSIHARLEADADWQRAE